MNQTLKILLLYDPPTINTCFDGETLRPNHLCPEPGMLVEMLGLFSRRLDIKIEFIYGPTLENGGKLVRNGTIDSISYFYGTESINAINAYEATLPIFYASFYLSETVFAVRRAENPITGAFDFFTVYDIKIWAGVFILFCVFSLLTAFAYRLEIITKRVKNERHQTISNIVWRLLRLKLFQSDIMEFKLLSNKSMLLIFAILQCGLIIRMYNNLVTLQTLKHVDLLPFKENEIFEVLKRKKYSLMFEDKHISWYESITRSFLSPYYDLREATTNNPIQLAVNLTDDPHPKEFMLREVDKGGWITALEFEDLDPVINKYCNLVYFKSGFPSRPMSLLFLKGNPFLPEINRVIHEDLVYLIKMYKKYYMIEKPSNCSLQRKTGPQALQMQPFYGVFCLFFLGIIFSIVMFILERYVLNKNF